MFGVLGIDNIEDEETKNILRIASSQGARIKNNKL
jgi:hypothetical protein